MNLQYRFVNPTAPKLCGHPSMTELSDLSSLISGARGRPQSVRCSEGGAPTADLFRKQYLSNPVKHGRSWAERWLESQGRWTAQVNNLERPAAAADDQCGRPGGAMTDRSKEMRGDQVVPWAGQLVWRHFEDSHQSSVEIVRYRSVRFFSFQKHWLQIKDLKSENNSLYKLFTSFHLVAY